jgi:hypothetical protein
MFYFTSSATIRQLLEEGVGRVKGDKRTKGMNKGTEGVRDEDTKKIIYFSISTDIFHKSQKPEYNILACTCMKCIYDPKILISIG